MTLVFTDGTKTVTIVPDDIIDEEKSRKKEIPVPGGNPVFIDLGRLGPYIKIQGWIPESERDDLANIPANSVVTIVSSDYNELTHTHEYYLTDKKINRKGGFCDTYRAVFSLTRKWS